MGIRRKSTEHIWRSAFHFLRLFRSLSAPKFSPSGRSSALAFHLPLFFRIYTQRAITIEHYTPEARKPLVSTQGLVFSIFKKGGDLINIVLFLKYYHGYLFAEFLQHLKIIAVSIPVSILISVPIGIYISSRPKLARIVIYIAGIVMTIPSLALFGIMVVAFAPLGMGLGMLPAVTAITVYSLLPITRNTYAALNSVPQGVLEAARGMGLSKTQTLWKIRIPLSIPVIMAGVRTSIVLGVGVATFATLVGAGGLGFFIFSGISRANFAMVLVGSLIVSALGIGINSLLMKFEDMVTPRGLKVGRK